jgi:hypothetical protein
MKALPPCQPSKHDNLFKELITAGWCVKSDGNVEAPTGYFSITEIPDHHGELVEMRDAITCDADRAPDEYQFLDNWPESGWYFTTENSDGIIYVYKVDKVSANRFFDEYSRQYSAWDDNQWAGNQ